MMERRYAWTRCRVKANGQRGLWRRPLGQPARADLEVGYIRWRHRKIPLIFRPIPDSNPSTARFTRCLTVP